jgi:hypothetical protein
MSTVVLHESAIIERLVLPPDQAAAIMSLAFSPADLRRMRELGERNNQGSLAVNHPFPSPSPSRGGEESWRWKASVASAPCSAFFNRGPGLHWPDDEVSAE